MSLTREVVSNREGVVGRDIGTFFDCRDRRLETGVWDTVGIRKDSPGSSERELCVNRDGLQSQLSIYRLTKDIPL